MTPDTAGQAGEPEQSRPAPTEEVFLEAAALFRQIVVGAGAIAVTETFGDVDLTQDQKQHIFDMATGEVSKVDDFLRFIRSRLAVILGEPQALEEMMSPVLAVRLPGLATYLQREQFELGIKSPPLYRLLGMNKTDWWRLRTGRKHVTLPQARAIAEEFANRQVYLIGDKRDEYIEKSIREMLDIPEDQENPETAW